MINQNWSETLVCPLNPSSGRLRLHNDQLECERCALRFLIKDGFPVMLVEEAVLPPGCESVSQLPCQREEKQKDVVGSRETAAWPLTRSREAPGSEGGSNK